MPEVGRLGALVDPNGAFDYDGDGKPELINTGCEACHGPGSEHLELEPSGSSYIVSPGPPDPGSRGDDLRELPFAAARDWRRCNGTASCLQKTRCPRSGSPTRARPAAHNPCKRRARRLFRLGGRQSALPTVFGPPSIAALPNSIPAHHVYRLPVTRTPTPMTSRRWIRPATPIRLCTTCHSPEANPELYPAAAHVADVTGVNGHASLEAFFGPFLCTACHMVPTAKSGAAVRALGRSLGAPPTVQYYWNDVVEPSHDG